MKLRSGLLKARKALGEMSGNVTRNIPSKRPGMKKRKRREDESEVESKSSEDDIQPKLKKRVRNDKFEIFRKLRPVEMIETDHEISISGPQTGDYGEYYSTMNHSFKLREVIYYVPREYISRQEDLSARMRSILVDWIVDIHLNFSLCSVTLWTAVNIVDRYLHLQPLTRNKLQQLGTSSLLIASKLYDVSPPIVEELVGIAEGGGRDAEETGREMVELEGDILQKLEYDVCGVTAYHFLSRLFLVVGVDAEMRFLCKYYGERALQEYDSLLFLPSLLAAGIFFTCRRALFLWRPEERVEYHDLWPSTLVSLTSFTISDLVQVDSFLTKHVGRDVKTASGRILNNAKKKYLTSSFMRVATIPTPPPVQPPSSSSSSLTSNSSTSSSLTQPSRRKRK